MDAQQIIVTLIIALGTGGLVTAVVAARKAGAEKQSIIVDAAQGAVIVQQGVIQSLQEQLAFARQEIAEHRVKLDDMDERLERCEETRRRVEAEFKVLQQETEVDQLAREGRIERREQ